MEREKPLKVLEYGAERLGLHEQGPEERREEAEEPEDLGKENGEEGLDSEKISGQCNGCHEAGLLLSVQP